MSLVSGPGRGGVAALPKKLNLVVDEHVKYIQSLDTVRPTFSPLKIRKLMR